MTPRCQTKGRGIIWSYDMSQTGPDAAGLNSIQIQPGTV
jgi:hypothetical protein